MMEWIQNRTYFQVDDVNFEFYTMLPAVLYREAVQLGTDIDFNCSSWVQCLSDLG